MEGITQMTRISYGHYIQIIVCTKKKKKFIHNTSKMQNISKELFKSEFTNVDFKIRKVHLSNMKCGSLRQIICIGKRMGESAIWEKIVRQQEHHTRRS